MKVLISAAEASSDVHGAELLRALQRLAPAGEVEAFGIGGPKLQEAGLQAVFDARELLSMGFSEVLGRLPRILSALRAITVAARERKPDIAIVIDYPDFHFRLARRLKLLGIPVIYYIPPKVWVWRKSRVRELQELFARVLCIFPFEESFLRREKVEASYVGNPLVEELPLRLSREEARRKLGVPDRALAVVLMPGSRPSELKKHVELMLEAAVIAAAILRSRGRLGPSDPLTVLMPLPQTAPFAETAARVASWNRGQGSSILDIRVTQGDSSLALLAADAGLIKSGTSTLEGALLGCPMAVVYRPSWLTGFLFRNLIRYRGPVGLVNLVSGWKPGDRYLASEILMEEMTPKRMAEELVSLLTDESARSRMKDDFRALRDSLMPANGAGSPSERAARAVLEVAGCAER